MPRIAYLRTADRASMDAALRACGLMQQGDMVLIGCDVVHIGQVGQDSRHHANILFHSDPSPQLLASLPAIEPPATPARGFLAEETQTQ